MKTIQLEQYNNDELRAIRAKAQDILNSRVAKNAAIVIVDLKLTGPATIRPWAKTVTGIDATQRGAYAFIGDFVRGPVIAAPKGSYILVGGSGKTGCTDEPERYYALIRVEAQEKFEAGNGKFSYAGVGAALVATSQDKIDKESALKRHPELAPVVVDETFPLAVALREAGF